MPHLEIIHQSKMVIPEECPKTLAASTHEGQALKDRNHHRGMEELSNGNHCHKWSYSQKGKAVIRSCDLPDRTIDLSHVILLKILSFLPASEAVQTSILSRRWRNLWRSISTVNFDVDEILSKIDPSANEQHSDRFVRLVDHYFEHNKLGHEIKELRLHIRSRFQYCHIEKWLNMANDRNVENLFLDLRGTDPLHPYQLVVGGKESSLRHFSLTNCLLSINPDFSGFNFLTSVSFENVMLPTNFISYCPLLEHLTLLNCKGVTKLKIAAHNLKYVRVVNSAKILMIYAANLNYFGCSGFVKAFLYPVVNENGGFLPIKIMGFPNPELPLTKCIFAPDPNYGGFKSLKVLSLFDLNLLAIHLRNLLSNCSSIEQLIFEDCAIGLSSGALEIFGLENLQSLRVLNCPGIEKVVVCATNLKNFAFVAGCFPLCLRGFFVLLDSAGNDFSSVLGKGSLLKHLDLRSGLFTINPANFSALETVTMVDTYLTEEHIGNLLSNCLLLESLNLKECHGFSTLDIVSPFLKLKYLSVLRCKQLMEIGTAAPNLVKFSYVGPMICISLREVPQLVSVEMKVESNCYENCAKQVISMLSRDVPQLQTLFLCIEDEEVPEALPTFCNLKHLVLLFGQKPHKLSWATLFLKASPFLENLRLELPCSYFIGAPGEPTYCTTWIHHHLKEAELFRFRGMKNEIKFATNLLDNVQSLQLMKIDPRPVNTSGPPLGWVQGGREKTLQLLNKEAKPGVKLVVL